MKPLLLLLILPVLALAAPPPPEAFITINDPGNPPDRNGLGSVAAPYRITKARVTQAQYADFLNATDPTGSNPLGLYNAEMAATKGGIVLNPDAPEGSRYAPRDAAGADEPVLFVSWADAARYANWLCNGANATASTESGAYDLASSNGARTARTPGAAYWIPDENEWYKAAFYRPGADGKPLYVKETDWAFLPEQRLVAEITSPAPALLTPEGQPEAVAEKLEEEPLLFSADLPPDAQNEAAFQGFRIATTVPADGKAVLPPVAEGKQVLEPVAEGPSDTSGPAVYSPGLSGPFGWPQAIIVQDLDDDGDDDDDDTPAS